MIHIVFYQPEIAQNTGATIRTAFATNTKFHIIKPISFEINHSKTKRAAAGHLISEIPYEIHQSSDDFFQKYGNKKIFYISRYGLKTYTKPNYKKELAQNEDLFFMFGRESTGIPKNILRDNLENVLRIPMSSKNRSLNLSNSVCIVIYEVLRQLDFQGLAEFEVQKGKYFLINDSKQSQ